MDTFIIIVITLAIALGIGYVIAMFADFRSDEMEDEYNYTEDEEDFI